MTKKYQAEINDRKKDFDHLYYEKAQILKSYNEKVAALREKGLEIKDLIEKAKDGADQGFLEILTKFEEANEKIFEKHPIDGQKDDYSILEATVQVEKPPLASQK